jgi:nitrate reductase molybdenum cofactor assembly chaperone
MKISFTPIRENADIRVRIRLFVWHFEEATCRSHGDQRIYGARLLRIIIENPEMQKFRPRLQKGKILRRPTIPCQLTKGGVGLLRMTIKKLELNEFIHWFSSLENELDDNINGSDKNRLLGFVATVKNMSLLRLQENYTQIFDMNPRTSLNLTYHSLGDTEERGRALAQLDQVYFQAGYERTTKELPDYLPLMLEFLAQCPDPEGIDLLWSQMGGVKNIAANLDDSDSPYRLLFEILIDLVESETG